VSVSLRHPRIVHLELSLCASLLSSANRAGYRVERKQTSYCHTTTVLTLKTKRSLSLDLLGYGSRIKFNTSSYELPFLLSTFTSYQLAYRRLQPPRLIRAVSLIPFVRFSSEQK
jgi:hypothetical protein